MQIKILIIIEMDTLIILVFTSFKKILNVVSLSFFVTIWLSNPFSITLRNIKYSYVLYKDNTLFSNINYTTKYNTYIIIT